MGFRSGFRGPRSARNIALSDSAHFRHFQRLAGINFQPDASAPGPRFSLAWPVDEFALSSAARQRRPALPHPGPCQCGAAELPAAAATPGHACRIPCEEEA